MFKLPLFGLALLLGLRHGIDWDHIAAITDVTGTSSENKKNGILLGMTYALGHGLVIIILGLLAVLIGVKLPKTVDSIMEPFVGGTLILLGLVLFYSIFRHGKNFRMQSRWMMVFRFIDRSIQFFHDRFPHSHLTVKDVAQKHHTHNHLHPDQYGFKTAFLVGIIHGIGAETPTQVLLFVTAAGVGGTLVGSFLVFAFVFGLLCSNMVITLISVTSYNTLKQNSTIYVILGLVTAVFSLVIGTLFLLHHGTVLPVIFGG